MIYPILVYLIVGLCSYLCGVCIKAFMAINDKEFRQMNNQWWVIVYIIYVKSYISVVIYYGVALFI